MDIGKYIGELLYHHDAVAVPGLGTFVNAYRPAEIDQVKGELHPPGKGATFNPNLVTDDGLLVNILQNRHQLDLDTAKATLQQYAEELKAALERQEIIDFPEVGRLYQDYENNLQFLPDHNNFSLEAYGLPTVDAYPVARPRSTTPPPPVTTSKSGAHRTANYALIGAIALGTVVILVAGYFLLFDHTRPAEEALLPVPTSRVNVSPSNEATDSMAEEQTDTGRVSSSPKAESPAAEEDWDSEKPTSAPGQKRLVIIIGAFGDKSNVTRLVDDIYDAGYEPYTEQSGSLTKVGVQRAYTEPQEVEQTLNDVRNRFNSDAKLIKK